MRILAISSWWPEPADNGSRLRILNLLRALAERHEVHLLALAQSPVEGLQRAEIARLCASDAAVEWRTYQPRRADLLSSLLDSRPASVRATWSPEFAALVEQRAVALRPDVAVAFELGAAPYALRAAAPLVLDEIEVGFQYNRYREQRGLRRLRGWLTSAQQRRYIAWLLRGFAAYTTVSEAEAALVRPLAGAARGAVIANGAELDRELPPEPSYEPGALIYPGALSFDANLDAMRFFLAEVFPAIRARRPDALLRITGRATPEQIAQLPASQGLELTGFVPDVRALIRRSAAEVVPLRQGGGTRLKVLEAMALGTPVIATSRGMEGIAARDGQHALIADTPQAFADATLRLLGDPQLRAQLAAQAWQLVRERYDWRVIGRTFVDLVERAASADAARSPASRPVAD